MVVLGGHVLNAVVYEVNIIEIVGKYVYVCCGGIIWALANANHMAYSFEHNMFWNPGSLSTNCTFLIRLYTLELAMLPMLLPSGGMNNLSAYML